MTGPLVDTHLYLERWPFRRLAGNEPPALVEKLQAVQVTQGWVASLDGVFHRDLTAANARLAETCRTLAPELLRPFGAVNPLLPDWQEDVRQIALVHRMPGIRLYPGYHGYTLASAEFAALLDAALRHQLFVQLVVMLEDERTQSRLARVPPVDLRPLTELVRARPALRLQLLNPFRGAAHDLVATLVAAGQVYVDLANLEMVGGVERLLERVPAERILFGSHYPLFYWEAAQLKLRESQLTDEQLALIRDARRVLPAPAAP